MKSITTIIHCLLIFLMPLNVGFMTASNGLQSEEQPDLAIQGGLIFQPDTPKIDQYIDVTAVIQNSGGPSPAFNLALRWCCGVVTQAMDAMQAGEIRTVTFENALTFHDAGTYTIEMVADPDSAVDDRDVSNNLRTDDVQVIVADTGLAFERTSWSDEATQHGCPDVPLMQIGRLGPPFVMEDSDDDGNLDRLKREVERCHRDYYDTTSPYYNPNYPACLVYKKGQEPCACGTTSLAYTLQYFGVDVSPDEIDAQLRFHERDMFTDPIGIKEFSQSQGLNAGIFINGTVEDLKFYTDQNIPVLLNISTTAGDPDIFGGHWVVALSVCQDEEASLGGVPKTTIVMYDPNGRQFGMSPSHLYEFWNDLSIWGVPLWTRLYIPVSYLSISDGNADGISERLAIAQALAEGGTGAQDFYDGCILLENNSCLEGTIEMVSGGFLALYSFFGMMIGWGEELPLVGGMLGSVAEFIGSTSLALSDISQGFADLFDPETWFDSDKFFGAVWDIISGVGELILSVFEFVFDFIVDGIWGLVKDIGAWFVEIGCDWFGIGCKHTVVHYKHTASRDPCMESLAFLNGYGRISQNYYLYLEQGVDRIPLYLYADPYQGDQDTLSETIRRYYVCNRPDWAQDDPKLLYLGLFGYSSPVNLGPGGMENTLSLDVFLRSRKMKLPNRADAVVCDPTDQYGYFLPELLDGSSPVYEMISLDFDHPVYTFSMDPCYETETFTTDKAQGYTREVVVGKIFTSPIDGTVKLYRAFREGVVDFMFYTDPEKILPGFTQEGVVGFIFAEQEPGTVPLYQFYYQGRNDHLLSLHAYAEGLAGYHDPEILGYVYPPEYEDSSCCLTPLWRFCKRREIQE